MAAHLWLNGNGHLCSTTAAHLMQLDGIPRPDRITVARTDGARGPHWLRIKRLLPEQLPPLRNVNGYRVPVVERLLLELSGELPPRCVGLALDDALRRGMTDLDRVRKMLDEVGGRGRRGTRTLRHMLLGRDLRDAGVRTAFETAMLRILKRIEDEAIVPNHLVRVGGQTFYLDFYIPSAHLGVECQSIRWHKGTDFLDKDMKRHRRISSLDIEVLYFTWDEVMFTPDLVEREIRNAIVRRKALAR
jgi:hypothetical protein